jgi:hypothetical protein
LRGECRAISGVTVVTTLVCHLTFAREAAGALGTRHSLRPLFIEGRTIFARPRAISAAGMRNYVSRHCEERSDQAIH